MKKFILVLADEDKEVEGENLNDACQKAGLTEEELGSLDHFIDEKGEEVQVFGEETCGCVYGAQEGITCIHDLERVGITYLSKSA